MLKCWRKLHRFISASGSPWGVNGPWQGCWGEETFSPWSHSLLAWKESQNCNPFLKKTPALLFCKGKGKKKSITWVLRCCSAPHLCGKQIIRKLGCEGVFLSLLRGGSNCPTFPGQRGWSWLDIRSFSGPAEAVPVHSWEPSPLCVEKGMLALKENRVEISSLLQTHFLQP